MRQKLIIITLTLLPCIVFGGDSTIEFQEINTKPDSIDFGSITTSDTLIQEVLIYNDTESVFNIDSVKTESSFFWVRGLTEETIKDSLIVGNDSLKLVVYFKSEEPGDYIDTLTIYTTSNNVSISLSAKRVLPAKIGAPTGSSYFYTIATGDSVLGELGIWNSGGTNLEYSMGITSTPLPEEPSYYGVREAYFPESGENVDLILQISKNTGLVLDTVFIVVDNSVTIDALAQKGEELYFNHPEDRNKISVLNLRKGIIDRELELGFAQDTENYISSLAHSGKKLFMVFYSKDEKIEYLVEVDENTGGFTDTLSYSNNELTNIASVSVNPLKELLYTTDHTSSVVKAFDLNTNTELDTLVSGEGFYLYNLSYSVKSNTILALGNRGPYSFFEFDAENGELIREFEYPEYFFADITANESSYVDYFEIISENKKGIITPDSVVFIQFKVKALKKLELGLYNSEIILESNDVENSRIIIPLTMSVVGSPKIEVSQSFFDLVFEKEDSLLLSFDVTNTGLSTLEYQTSIHTKKAGEEVTFYTAEVDDNTNIIEYSLSGGTILMKDTLYSRPFGAWGIRGMSLYKNELFFIDDKDDFEILKIDVNNYEITGKTEFVGYPEVLSLAHYNSQLLSLNFDHERNQQSVISVSLRHAEFRDTLARNSEFGNIQIHSFSVNPERNELYVLSGSSIHIKNLMNGETRELIPENVNLRFHHSGYSYTEDKLYVSGYDLTKPEGENLGIFVIDPNVTDEIEFISFHHEVGALVFDETGIPPFIEDFWESGGSMSPGYSQEVTFEVDATQLPAGEYYAELKVTSNDPEKRELKIPINLTIVEPSIISIESGQLEFTVEQGDSAYGSISISNTGGRDLIYRGEFRGTVREQRPGEETDFFYASITSQLESDEGSYIIKKSYSTGEVLDTLYTVSHDIDFIRALAVNGNHLYFNNPANGKEILVFDIAEKAIRKKISINADINTEIGGPVQSFSHTGSSIYSIMRLGENRSLVEIDEFSGSILDTLIITEASDIQFVSSTVNTNRNLVFTANYFDGLVRVFDIETKERLSNLAVIPTRHSLSNIGYSYSRNSVLVQILDDDSGESVARLVEIDADTGEEIQRIELHGQYLTGLATDESNLITSYVEFDSPGYDTLGFNSTREINFTVRTEDLDPGVYESELILHSNASANPSIQIPFLLTVTMPTSAEFEHGIPENVELSQNYPNPFNPTTTIQYGLPKAGNVLLMVYNSIGQEVLTLVDDFKSAGRYSISLDARSLSSGVYFYQFKIDGKTYEVKKMLLVK